MCVISGTLRYTCWWEGQRAWEGSDVTGHLGLQQPTVDIIVLPHLSRLFLPDEVTPVPPDTIR